MRAAVSTAIVLALTAFPLSARAHDVWADGSAIPAWVKSSCCGPSDAHLLSSEDVSQQDDGWHIRGINTVVPNNMVLPSQDGRIWGFWNPNVGPNPPVYCLFIPMEF